nr:integrase, catalytic region, zinc finger, CCHC-type, peptidase aspartic, catalytic [Tanacetum cinerariifolium]GEZ96468.1 integrase, catalytic region, zinc finger, CCHC-type, peptidase aspartic, catalytic [Tanacetum cinerariifolium]
DNICGTSTNTKFAKQSILGKPSKVGEIHALSKPVTSNSVPTPQESKVVKNDKFMGTVRFRNDHVAAILGFGDLQWGNILITRRLHLLQIDLCGPMRIASKNGKRIYNQRTKKIMETMNVTFDELSAMDFKQRSSKPGLQSMTSGRISLGLDLTYAPSTITTQPPTEGELDLLFEAMYDDYIGGQPSAALRTVLVAQAQQVRQTSTTSTSIAETAPTPTNSSSHATNFLNTLQDVDELNSQQQHAQQQGNQATL